MRETNVQPSLYYKLMPCLVDAYPAIKKILIYSIF